MSGVLYGPVGSWRLGRSLGVDMIASRHKLCSFDCIYCQLGATTRAVARRREFVSLEELGVALRSVGSVVVDHATFSGMGEPTLASNLGEAIELVRSVLKVPVAVLTNATLMHRADVRHELARADVVVAKLDAPDEALWREIDRPRVKCSLSRIIEAIKLFRNEYAGKLALQMMFLEINKDRGAEMARLARDISPHEVQINTPLRPCAVRPLPPEGIAAIRCEFSGVDGVVTVYESSTPPITPLDQAATERRRSMVTEKASKTA